MGTHRRGMGVMPANRVSKAVLVVQMTVGTCNAVRALARARNDTISGTAEYLLRLGLADHLERRPKHVEE